MKPTSTVFITTLFFLNACFSLGQDYLKSSKKFIHPFNEVDSEVLSNHINIIADSVRIIGLGEVTHYTKECYELKHQIIQELMNKGFDALVLEVDFGQAILWNDYVVNGTGNIDSIIAQSGWFTYRTLEFKKILMSIRDHNMTAEKPFQVIGMEMTAMNYNLSWLAGYLEEVDSARLLINQLKEDRKIIAFQQHDDKEVQSYWKLYYELDDFLTQHQENLRAKKGEDAYLIAIHLCEIMRQYATYISQDDFSLQIEFRDQFSSRNVLWSMNYLGEDSRIALWAHNGHIVKKSVLFDYAVLGSYLSGWFGNAYYSIGFTFNQGDFGAFGSSGFSKFTLPSVTEPSLIKDFDRYEANFLYFDIRKNLSVKNSRSKKPFLSEVLTRSDISESYSQPEGANPMMTIDLSNSYDCLIYIDKTSYPTTINWDY